MVELSGDLILLKIMNYSLPEVRINFSWLLYEVSIQLEKIYDKGLDSQESCEKYADAYRNEWKKYENKILPALVEVLDIEFYKPVIDVNLAPYFIPQSDPLIIHFRAEPDEFVDILTHELTHVLLTDNNKYSTKANPDDNRLNEGWEELFGKDHDFNTLVHIPVHAICKYIFLDVLKQPERLERELNKTGKKNMQAYVDSWAYVEKNGYKSIIEKLKNFYKDI